MQLIGVLKPGDIVWFVNIYYLLIQDHIKINYSVYNIALSLIHFFHSTSVMDKRNDIVRKHERTNLKRLHVQISPKFPVLYETVHGTIA